jgi:REP-associated tyrosine transposase
MDSFSYVGKYRYFLTFCTHDRKAYFRTADTVALVRTQILRAASQYQFLIVAYCFMPDHVHLLTDGVSEGSDLRAFIKAAKQYSGYHFKQQHHTKLWQRYGYEHTLRDDIERATTIRYILDNPVDAHLAKEPEDYPFIGSERYTISELLQQAAPRG